MYLLLRLLEVKVIAGPVDYVIFATSIIGLSPSICLLVLFVSFPGCFSLSDNFDFPFAHNLSILNKMGLFLNLSCQNNTNPDEDIIHPRQGNDCHCDRACLFLGDCCYDYQIENKNSKNLSLVAALEEQLNTYQRFAEKASCVQFRTPAEMKHGIYARMVSGCPERSSSRENDLCRGREQINVATHIPVVADDVLFNNAYCAACHGISMEQIEMVSDTYAVRCHYQDERRYLKSSKQLRVEWIHFAHDFYCPQAITGMNKKFTTLVRRAIDFCDCGTFNHDEDCPSGIYSRECHSYRAVFGNDSSAKNDACLACFGEQDAMLAKREKLSHSHCITNGGQEDELNPNELVFTRLFKFTSSSQANGCPILHDVGRPGDHCLVKTCQSDYRLYSGRCMSPKEIMACFRPHEDHFSPNYHTADLYRPALLIFMKDTEWKKVESKMFQSYLHKLLTKSKPCSLLKHSIYQDLLLDKLPLKTQCRLLYLAALSFTSVVQQVESGIFNGGLFGSLNVFKFGVINHDPIKGLNCSGNIGYEVVTHRIHSSFRALKFKTRNVNKVIASNRDPMIVVKHVEKLGSQIVVLFCQPNENRDGCSWRNNGTPDTFENCPKYELTALPKFMASQSNARHQQSDKNNIFVCSDIYDEQYTNVTPHIMVFSVMACYSVSLICLLATFGIHVRYRPLRTLPGLMLMNMIGALFIAQCSYMLNSITLFQAQPILCQAMAAVQHYFWLASFVWMACMSLDIFSCLAASCTTVNTYSAAKYCKYVLIGWMAPLPVPLMALTFTNTDLGGYGYDLALCWLSGGKAVLFFFALPVLTIVCFNLVLFVGSVCRLSLLMKNAAYVGRKEDNKRRLIQCAKLSSWMGISWLFGIVPNFLDIDILWYVFGVANAFQGVHIFVAFGLAGRAKGLLKRGGEEKGKYRDNNSTAVQTVSSVCQDAP